MVVEWREVEMVETSELVVMELALFVVVVLMVVALQLSVVVFVKVVTVETVLGVLEKLFVEVESVVVPGLYLLVFVLHL